MRFTSIDNWQPSDTVTIAFDSRALFTYKPYQAILQKGSALCSITAQNDYRHMFVGRFYHSASSVTIKITITSQSATAPAFGIKDLQMTFRNILVQDTTEYIVDAIGDLSIPGSSPCVLYLYLDGNGNCSPCVSQCAACTGPTALDCILYNWESNYIPKTGLVVCGGNCQICIATSPTTICTMCKPNYILNTDGSCQASCTSPAIARQNQNSWVGICINPCPNGQFMYWNYTCNSRCDPPLQQVDQGVQGIFCQYPCNSTQYMSENGTCLTSCPYYIRNENDYLYCDRCSPQAFYYPNNDTCMTTCAIYFLANQVNRTMYCNYPCPSKRFLYQNGSCISLCNSPFNQRIEGTLKFCDFPCSSSKYYESDQNICLDSCDFPNIRISQFQCKIVLPTQDPQSPSNISDPSPQNSTQCSLGQYYYPDLDTCFTNCRSPYILKPNNTCGLNLSPEDTNTGKIIAKALDTTSQVNSITASIDSLLVFSDPSLYCIVSLNKMIYYIRYIDIVYSPTLQQILDQKLANYNNMVLPTTYDHLQRDISNHTLPSEFAKYKLNSSFLIDFWASFMFICLIFLAILILWILEYSQSKYLRVRASIIEIRKRLRWNFVITRFLIEYDSIILFSTFQLRTIGQTSGLGYLSLVTCLLINLVGLIIPCKAFHLIYKLQKKYKKRQRNRDALTPVNATEKKLVKLGYEVVFQDYNRTSILSQAFIPIFILRIYLFYLIISLLYSYPLIQSILVTLLNIFMLIYIFKYKPFKKKWNQGQYITQEILLLAVNVSLVVLTQVDSTTSKGISTINNLGLLIISCNVIFTFLGCLSIFTTICLHLREFYRNYKASQLERQQLPRPNALEDTISNPHDKSNLIKEESVLENSVLEPKVKTPKSPIVRVEVKEKTKNGKSKGKGKKSKRSLKIKTRDT